MRAVVIREHGDYDRLLFEERPIPEPGPGEVRVRVQAAALNHLDTWVRRGVPGHKFPLPLIPGCDGAGVIDALGAGVTSPAIGSEIVIAPGFGCNACENCADGDDHLCRHYGIFGETRDGTCAEYVCIPARNALVKPQFLSFEHAAAYPLTFLTAWHMLVERAQVTMGDDVLVQAAGSGVGVAAIQIAKLFGARVIATAGSQRKCDLARALGADVVVDYSKDDFTKVVREITQKRGVAIAIDHVGEPTIARSIQCLAKGGRLVTCGATAGFSLATDLRLIFFKSLSILGSTMGSLGELHDITRLVGAGKLAPVIHEVLPLDRIRDAHRILGEREVFGKVVVTP
jgi:NADPH:quinone reductase-like Zn-dependent oxidoreductase